MIEKLTPEMEARLPFFRDKWLKIGLSTEPLNFEAAKAAAIEAYKVAGLEPPKKFLQFRSPVEAARAVAELKGVKNAKDQINDQIYGCHDAGWLSFYDVMIEFGVKDAEKLIPLINIAHNCGWWAPYENICILQDRPELIKQDDANLLHCEDGPSVRFRDGFSIYSWHGVRIFKEWIEDKASLTPQIALTHPNLEERRAACEIVGWHNVLKQLNAKVIDKDVDPTVGELLEVTIPDVGQQKFLHVLCATGREFALPVPAEVNTALEANSWTWGIDPIEYKPEVQT